MRRLLRTLLAIRRPVSLLLDAVTTLLLALLVLLTAQQVFMRYLFDSPAKWSEELTIAMLIWFGYLGITVGYRDGKHLSITVFSDRLPPGGQKALSVFVDLVMLTFCTLMAWQGVLLVRLDVINVMPATGISMSWVSVVLVVSATLMVLEALIKLLCHATGLAGEESVK